VGNSSFSHVILPLCISNIDLNGQEVVWRHWHELVLIESLGSSAKDERSDGMMQNPVERQVLLVSLNMKRNNFLLLPQNFPGLAQKHAGGATYEKFILLFFMQYILNG